MFHVGHSCSENGAHTTAAVVPCQEPVVGWVGIRVVPCPAWLAFHARDPTHKLTETRWFLSLRHW